MPSRDVTERKILYAIGIVAVLTLLYSVLITQAILAWFSIVVPLLFLYLLWRFVRAHERIARALETRGGATSGDAADDAFTDTSGDDTDTSGNAASETSSDIEE